LIAFVERDYEVSSLAAGSAQTAVVASRSVGFTLLSVLVGLGISRTNGALLLVAAVTSVAIALVDAYYTSRADERDRYLEELEAVLGAFYSFTQRGPNNARELRRLEQRLAALRTGSTSQIKTFKWRDLKYLKPRILFHYLYPGLLGICILFGALYGYADLSKEEKRRCEPQSRSLLIAEKCKHRELNEQASGARLQG